MIQFYGDHLAPPELCRLLYLTVPEEFHVPVVFHNHTTSEIDGPWLAVCAGGKLIHLKLHRIYADVHSMSESMTVRTWRRLLEVCYHEFGHVANWDEIDDALHAAYPHDDRAHEYIEELADGWRDRRLRTLLDHDARLAQPTLLRGYLGARISREMDLLKGTPKGSGKAAYVKEVRTRRTGGQLRAGDVLAHLHLPNTGANLRGLRRVSEDIGAGIEYVDSSDRHHKLYTWGDLRLLAAHVVETAVEEPNEPDHDRAAHSDDYTNSPGAAATRHQGGLL